MINKADNNYCQKPIGFFDSGIGGISVLKEAIKILPGEDFIYLGDNKNVPYGNKTESEIKRLSLANGSFLFNKGVKAIVVACNTATSIAIREMRSIFNIPVISIEPAVKPAIESPYLGKILVMATPATISQSRYQNLVNRLGSRERIIDIPCDGLADLIECGNLDGDDITNYIEEKLRPFSRITIAGIVLGCTHYSFIENKINAVAKTMFQTKFGIFDGKYGVARRLKNILEQNDLRNKHTRNNHIDFYVTGDHHEIAKYKKYLFSEMNEI